MTDILIITVVLVGIIAYFIGLLILAITAGPVTRERFIGRQHSTGSKPPNRRTLVNRPWSKPPEDLEMRLD